MNMDLVKKQMQYIDDVKSGKVKPFTIHDRWKEQGDFDIVSTKEELEEYRQRMEYFNSEEGLKLWDEAMEENKPGK